MDTIASPTAREAAFTRMDEGTRQDWQIIAAEHQPHFRQVPETIKAMLRQLADLKVGFAVDQLTHSLQTATRAERGGASEEMVIAALCHDIGKTITVANHPAIAAEILKPYVSEEAYWVILTHQDFQGRHYYQYLGLDTAAREKHRAHPSFATGEQFADEWDQTSFDPAYDTLPLSHFEPLIDRIFAQPKKVVS